MKTINIFHGDDLVATSYNIENIDIKPVRNGYIEFIEHYPGGNPKHDMYKEAQNIVYLYPDESMCIRNGYPSFYNNSKYYMLPKDCYSVYRGKRQERKTIQQIYKEGNL